MAENLPSIYNRDHSRQGYYTKPAAQYEQRHMTKQPSAEQLITESDIKTQNELIHYDDHMSGINKNLKAFWGLDSAKDRGISAENRAIANSSSLPNLNTNKNSPAQNQYASQPYIRDYSPHSAVEYGGGAISLEPRKY